MVLSFPRLPLALGAMFFLALSNCALDRSGQQLFEETTAATSATSGTGGGISLAVSSGAQTTATSSGAGAAGGASQSTTTGSGGAGGGKVAECGDGVIDVGEACDDMNLVVDDGCNAMCEVEPWWFCRDEPSDCVAHVGFKKNVSPDVDLSDKNKQPTIYDGTLDFPSMYCAEINVMNMGPDLGKVILKLKLENKSAGDLVVKVQSPAQTITTVLSRPGYAEPSDAADDGQGAPCNIKAPIYFDDDVTHSAEDMGLNNMMMPVADGDEVCTMSNVCWFKPSPGQGEGINGLADFSGEDPNGTWRVCVADAKQFKDKTSFGEAELYFAAF